MSENDFECFASTGVKAPGQSFLILADAKAKFLYRHSTGSPLLGDANVSGVTLCVV